MRGRKFIFWIQDQDFHFGSDRQYFLCSFVFLGGFLNNIFFFNKFFFSNEFIFCFLLLFIFWIFDFSAISTITV